MQCPPTSARAERQKVPLGARGGEHFLGVDADAVADEGEFVDERDVDVALGVLDHLGRFGHLDAAHPVSAGGDDARVELIDEVGGFGGGAGGNLFDGGEAVFPVAGVDAFGGIAGVEVEVEFES